jgi:hypothetical protein
MYGIPTSPPTSIATTPEGFFKLPRELRDMVYHELWKATPCLEVLTQPVREYDPVGWSTEE